MSSTPSPVARGKGATHHILKVDRRTSRPSRAELNERRGPHRSPAHGRTFQHDSSPRCERGRLWAGHLAVRNPINDLRLMIGPCSPNQYPLDPNDELPGDIGAAFAGGAKVGPAINAATARAAISTFMTRLHLWTIVLIWTSAPRPIGRRLRETCQGLRSHAVMRITAFRTIQNDSGRSDWPASAKSSTAVQTVLQPAVFRRRCGRSERARRQAFQKRWPSRGAPAA
jgi:hypothetical protein